MVSLFDYTPLWLFLTGHGLYCLNSSFTGYFFFWEWYLLFHFPHWFIITWHDFYCFTSLIGSSLLGMVCFLSLHASLVHHYWIWFVWLDYELHWFFLNWYGLYCLTWCITGSFLLFIVCICSHPSLVHCYWAWFVLFHFLRWFISIKHDLYLSFQASLVHHLLAWFVLFYYKLHWFFLTGHGLHCYTSCFTVSFLLGIVCIFSLPTLVHLYWAWLVLFTSRFTGSFFTEHVLYCFTSLTGS